MLKVQVRNVYKYGCLCLGYRGLTSYAQHTSINTVLSKSNIYNTTLSKRFHSSATTMSSKKLITVFGATGNQGGSVVKIFLNDPKLKNDWSVRGVSRNADSDSSKNLTAQGVEMVSVRLSLVHLQYLEDSQSIC